MFMALEHDFDILRPAYDCGLVIRKRKIYVGIYPPRIFAWPRVAA